LSCCTLALHLHNKVLTEFQEISPPSNSPPAISPASPSKLRSNSAGRLLVLKQQKEYDAAASTPRREDASSDARTYAVAVKEFVRELKTKGNQVPFWLYFEAIIRQLFFFFCIVRDL
jgi:hypothetical protein